MAGRVSTDIGDSALLGKEEARQQVNALPAAYNT